MRVRKMRTLAGDQYTRAFDKPREVLQRAACDDLVGFDIGLDLQLVRAIVLLQPPILGGIAFAQSDGLFFGHIEPPVADDKAVVIHAADDEWRRDRHALTDIGLAVRDEFVKRDTCLSHHRHRQQDKPCQYYSFRPSRNF